MIEEVLGFKKKGGISYGEDINHIEHIKVRPENLVPVVSIECLEKWLQKRIAEKATTFTKTKEGEANYHGYLEGVADMLSVAKKEAEK